MKRAAPAAPAPASARESQVLGAAAFLILILYLAYPDQVFVFDGVMFSTIIERTVDNWRDELFNRRHLLFNPFFMVLRDGLAALGAPVGAYALMQRFNAVAGVAGLLAFRRLLVDLVEDRALAGLGALALAASFGYWSRATEGQVYMMMTVWGLAAGWAAFAFARAPSPRGALALAGCLAGAILFHGANAVLLPMAALAAWGAGAKSGRLDGLWAAPFLAAAVAIPYAAAFRIRDAASLLSFFRQATEFYSPARGGSFAGLFGHFFERGLGLGALAQSAWLCLAASGESGAAAAGGAVLFAACAVTAASLWRARPARRLEVALLAFWGAGHVALDALWHGGVFFWTVPCAAALALAALGAREFLPASRRVAALRLGGAAVAVLAGWNLHAGIRPQSRLENNVGYQRSVFVGAHTVASSWIVISGYGFPNAKVYLPYFAHRTREALELYLNHYPKAEALQNFRGFVQRNLEWGVPLYLLSDLVEDASVAKTLRENWGVSMDEVRGCFGPGSLLGVAEQDPKFRVFLFVPADGPERLYTALAYSVLTENDMPRLKETAHAMEQMAGLMTPAQRRAVPRVMKETDYGAQLLLRGFLTYMNPESQRAALARVAAYDAWQKSPDFHLRLGNLYRYLGLAAEVRGEWTIAYRATHDAQLGKDLASLPK